jgi:hypothetical protein
MAMKGVHENSASKESGSIPPPLYWCPSCSSQSASASGTANIPPMSGEKFSQIPDPGFRHAVDVGIKQDLTRAGCTARQRMFLLDHAR